MASPTMGERSMCDIHNASILKNLSAGDLIEFPRGVYSHWAVYVGNRQVIHLAGVGNDGANANVHSGQMFSICGARFNKAKVCIEDFWKVAAGSLACKNNSKDATWRPFNPAEIIRNATSQLGEVGYNLLYLNCEHFAKWCRYGKASSDQVDQVMTGASLGMVITAVLIVVIVVIVAVAINLIRKQQKKQAKNRTEKTLNIFSSLIPCCKVTGKGYWYYDSFTDICVRSQD